LSEIEFEIDGKLVFANQGDSIISIADREGIDVPRFCYHKKLSVAANCRMCLVDVEGVPKAQPACSTPVANGMKIHTRNDKAKSAQKAVMEFLLINHPLDCPICDQGGECELQDVAMEYGTDVSKFNLGKRIVADKGIGALIQTDMTRCIHCTRCVRFGAEVAGIVEMGGTGRGEGVKIEPFLTEGIQSELSGNMIDVCPVGALTSKPFRYEAT
jgi:NADH-quinone oxidoreductase subunit G